MKETRSFEIKKILKKEYPDNQFKVRIEKYSMGETIRVYTDRVIEFENKKAEYQMNEDEKQERQEITELNHKIKNEIQALLKDFSHVDRCEITGEILSGGNTYLFVEEYSATQWL